MILMRTRRLLKSLSTSHSNRDMVAPRMIASELLERRKENRQRGKSTILNSADIQIIGSHCHGTQPSVLINSEGCSYLFNCGEGFQRSCYGYKVKLTNLRHLFLTNLDWQNLSGAYGLSLTLQDLGAPSFTLHGPQGVGDFFRSSSSFLRFTTGIECNVHVLGEEEYKDSSITIKPVVLDSANKQIDHQNTSKRLKKASKLISYICTLPELPGSLDPQKCREMRVPVGPKLSILKSGRDITLDDGTVVKSSDVCGPRIQGLRLLVIECPTIEDIDYVTMNTLLDHQKLLRFVTDGTEVGMVIHFSPKGVYTNERYAKWMNGFSKGCKHVLLASNDATRPNCLDSYRQQYLLHQIDEDLFPNLDLPDHLVLQMHRELSEARKSTLDYGISDPDEAELKYVSKGSLLDQERVYQASTLDKFIIRPNATVHSVEERLSIDAVFKNASLEPSFEEKLGEYRSWQRSQPPAAAHEPEVVFLGTGSALPSKLRNTTCILVNMTLPHKTSFILDCGEDSHGQMMRFYGQKQTETILNQLNFIFISHHHADHHIGLIEILRKMKSSGRTKKVLLLLPPGIADHLNYYNENFEDLSTLYSIISTKSLKSKPSSGLVSDELIDSLVKQVQVQSNYLVRDVKVVGVNHCANSCAVSLDMNIGQPTMDTFKLSYSGDARPSEDLALIGEGCDLLIHEATFDHRDQSGALVKKHSTTAEAIEVSRRMRARYTILTHFSQRYPKIPYFTSEFDDSIGYAFDNMRVKCPSYYPRLPRMKGILCNVFSKSLNEIDTKYSKIADRQRLIDALVKSGSAESL